MTPALNDATENAALTLDSEEPINPNEGLAEPDDSMSHVSEFVAALSEEEFAFLESEVQARKNGENDPDMKSAEEVEFDLETLEDVKGATKNRSLE